jgi:RimJ/RimL family protein N-acetyltransferase
MEINVIKVDLKEIQAFRILFLQENNFQFVHNKCHLYNWADTYLFKIDDIKIGYGSVWGRNKREDRDAIFEFYVIISYRKYTNTCFEKFHSSSGVSFIECQSNDLLLSSMLFEYSQNINAEAILFKDHFQTDFKIAGVILEKKIADENVRDDNREYILKQNDEVVATGGLMLNYNIPYADIYYEVNEKHRQKGFGSFMIQELKKEAYCMGRIPAARCNIKNKISKSSLLKAGFIVCGCILHGEI